MANGRVCPVWIGYLLLFPLRKLYQNPDKILGPYLKEGMTALDVGSAMGYFSLPMAEMTGEKGRVICVDLQEKMLVKLKKRARKSGLEKRIETRVCSADSLNIDDLKGRVDFALAFAMIHETPDVYYTILQVYNTLKPGGRMLIAEPKAHINDDDYKETLDAAAKCGFRVIDEPVIRQSRAVLLEK